MATTLPNRAQITYTYNGIQESVLSNQTSTILMDQYTITASKDALIDTVRPGGTAAYIIRIENNGSGNLYNPVVTDDLGAGTPPAAAQPLQYVENSALFFLNGDPVTGTATVTANGVTFSTAAVLEPSSSILIAYSAALDNTTESTVTNTATASANSGSAAGDPVTDTASAVINVESFANVSVFKAADQESVVSGDTLTYTFSLMNTGNQAVESVNFVDELPSEFTVNTVSYTVNGVSQQLTPADYTISSSNTLTVPSPTSTVVIGVPAAEMTMPGVSVITVTGTIA